MAYSSVRRKECISSWPSYKDAGFYHSKTDSSLFIFYKGPDTTYLLLYVDDIILTASSTSLMQRINFLLHAEFAMTDLGPLNYFLSISATRTTTDIFLSETKYVIEILERAQMLNCDLAGPQLTLKRSLDLKDHRSLILLYIAAFPEYFSTSPLPDPICHMQFNSYVVRLRTDLLLDTIFLGDNLLTWSSKHQDTLSRSSAEAEYRGVTNAVAETSWIRNLLRELHTPLFTATLVNVSVVYMSANPVQH
ncbi:ribonuclease H-like domain-containing protein [Tanacetum coccineum]